MSIDKNQVYEPEVPAKSASQWVIKLDHDDDQKPTDNEPKEIRNGRHKRTYNRDTVQRLIDVIKDK